MGAYYDQLSRAMEMLAENEKTMFIGQSVACDGTAMRGTLRGVREDKLLELPVVEDMQMGMAIGMSLSGLIPVCLYPRINFLLLAVNQLVSHLDKLPLYSEYRPKVIIRTAIGSDQPLNPGVQHLGDYSAALEAMLSTVRVVRLERAEQIVPAYQEALSSESSTLLVEFMRSY